MLRKQLAAEGIKTAKGKVAWSKLAIERMLTNEKYADVAHILFNICENQTICIMPYSRRVLISGDESEFMEPSNNIFHF